MRVEAKRHVLAVFVLHHLLAAQAVGGHAHVPVVDADAVAILVNIGRLEHFIVAGEDRSYLVLLEKRFEVTHGRTRLQIGELVTHGGAVRTVRVGHVVVLHHDGLTLGTGILELGFEPLVLIRTGHEVRLINRVRVLAFAPPTGFNRFREVAADLLHGELVLGVGAELFLGNIRVIALHIRGSGQGLVVRIALLLLRLRRLGRLIRLTIRRVERDEGDRAVIGAMVSIARIGVIRTMGIENLVVGGAGADHGGAIVRGAVTVNLVVAQGGNYRDGIERVALIACEVAEPFIPMRLRGGALGDIAWEQQQIRISIGNSGVVDLLRLILGEGVVHGILAVTGATTELLIPGGTLARAILGTFSEVERLLPLAVGHAANRIGFRIRESNNVNRLGELGARRRKRREVRGVLVAINFHLVLVGGISRQTVEINRVLEGLIGTNPRTLRNLEGLLTGEVALREFVVLVIIDGVVNALDGLNQTGRGQARAGYRQLRVMSELGEPIDCDARIGRPLQVRQHAESRPRVERNGLAVHHRRIVIR